MQAISFTRIERVGRIDLSTRLKRRREERPADAYGALLRAIVGQQLSTKAARTIYLRVLEIFDGTIASLKRFKDDVREVREGFECGIQVENFNDVKTGDIIECYRTENVARTLESTIAPT